MAKKEIVITKSEISDDTDVDFATSDDNMDLIVRELDLVTKFLERDEFNKNMRCYKSENRERINENQRKWSKKNPEKIQEYNDRRDKVAKRKRARELYQVHREKELERQRIIREKRRAAKLAQQNFASADVSDKIKQGTQKIIKRTMDAGNIIKQNGDMEL